MYKNSATIASCRKVKGGGKNESRTEAYSETHVLNHLHSLALPIRYNYTTELKTPTPTSYIANTRMTNSSFPLQKHNNIPRYEDKEYYTCTLKIYYDIVSTP